MPHISFNDTVAGKSIAMNWATAGRCGRGLPILLSVCHPIFQKKDEYSTHCNEIGGAMSFTRRLYFSVAIDCWLAYPTAEKLARLAYAIWRDLASKRHVFKNKVGGETGVHHFSGNVACGVARRDPSVGKQRNSSFRVNRARDTDIAVASIVEGRSKTAETDSARPAKEHIFLPSLLFPHKHLRRSFLKPALT